MNTDRMVRVAHRLAGTHEAGMLDSAWNKLKNMFNKGELPEKRDIERYVDTFIKFSAHIEAELDYALQQSNTAVDRISNKKSSEAMQAAYDEVVGAMKAEKNYNLAIGQLYSDLLAVANLVSKRGGLKTDQIQELLNVSSLAKQLVYLSQDDVDTYKGETPKTTAGTVFNNEKLTKCWSESVDANAYLKKIGHMFAVAKRAMKDNNEVVEHLFDLSSYESERQRSQGEKSELRGAERRRSDAGLV